jgi:sporulation protein YlmC with PRC-barrel domain
MKKCFLHSTALALVVAAPALIANAQTSPGPSSPPDQPSGAAGGATAQGVITQQQPNDMLARSLIGMSVRNQQDESIGKIDDVVIDDKGQVKAVIVSVGGFLGIGDKDVALPWAEVRVDADRKRAVVNATKDQLTQAPAFKTVEQQKRDEDRARRAAETEEQAARQRSGAPAGGPVGAPPPSPAPAR